MQNITENLYTASISEEASESWISASPHQADPFSASASAREGVGASLVFIDAQVEGFQALVDSASPNAEVFLLSSLSDGIKQISDIVSSYESVSSIHIVSHGSENSLQLGTSQLSSETLELYRDELTGWSGFLTSDADVFLYGCNLAAGEDGQAFIQLFGEMTGADIAASTDLTGSQALGGDWEFEVATGTIESELAFQAGSLQLFADVLHAPPPAVPSDPNFQNELVVSGLNRPTSLEFLPDGRALILEKNGRILITDPSSAVPELDTYLVLPNILTSGEKGLIDIALHPDFEQNGFLYVYYTLGSDRKFQISRFTHQGNTANLNSEVVIWKDPNPASSPDHFGGGLFTARQGGKDYIFLTTGDKGLNTPQLAQDKTRIEGKILRLNIDGTIPTDNPFVDGPGKNADEIWAYGLRNPFRASYDESTGNIYVGDVGFDTTEEVNRINISNNSGVNFGWPLYEGTSNGAPGFVDPIYQYAHTDATLGGSGAVIGGSIYRGTAFPEEFQGAYFFADFTQDNIQYLKFDASGKVIDAHPDTATVDAFLFEQGTGNINPKVHTPVFVGEGPDGALYFLNFSGSLRRITYFDPSGGNQSPVINEQLTKASFNGGLTYTFTGVANDPDGDPITYVWDFGDGSQVSTTANSVSHTYAAKGAYEVTLVASDGQASTPDDRYTLPTIQLGAPPAAEIVLRAANGTLLTIVTEPDPITGLDRKVIKDAFRAGDTILFEGIGTDSDGTLGESSYEWEIRFLHDDHAHPEDTVLGMSTGSFVTTTVEHGFFADIQAGYTFELTITDSDGLQTTEQVDLLPKTVDLTFEDNLAGDVNFSIDDISRISSDANPFTLNTAINFEHTITAPGTRTVNGSTYVFDSWSTGQTTSTITISAPELAQTYIANYVKSSVNGSPLPITSGLVLQLDADRDVITDGSGSVTGWLDQSNAGNDLTGGGNPRLVNGAVNGRSAIFFDGNGDKLERTLNLNLPTGNSDRTVFLVAKYNSNGNGGFSYGQAARGKTFGLINNAKGKLGVQGWGNANDAPTSEAGTGQGWLVQSAKLQAGTLSQYKDGQTISTKSANFNTNLSQLVIGSEIDGSPFLDMQVASVLVFDRALSEAERQQVESYLQDLYLGTGGSGNVSPTAIPDSFSIAGNSVNNNLNVLGNDNDPDGNPLMITAVGATSNAGTVTINASNNGLIYTPAAGFSGTEVFNYTISDGQGGSATASVTLTVSGINRTPVAVGDSYSIVANSTANFLNVLNNDSDPDGDPLTIIDLTDPDSGGTVSISPDGKGLIYTPAAGFIGTETFTYNIQDPSGASNAFSPAAISITVREVSNVPVTSGLVLNLDADRGVTTSGAQVTEWVDQSGLGNNLASIGDPNLIIGALNGHNVIDLDGDGDALQRLANITGLPTGNSNRTVFLVANYNSVGNGGFTYGTSRRNESFGLVVDENGDLGVQGWSNASDKISTEDGTGQGWLIQTAKLDGGTLTQRKNGVLIDTDVVNYDTRLNKIVLGAELDGSPTVDMSVAAVLVFNRALSDVEQQQVETYLQAKYFGT
jgi:glucose/arabinose dehydrogenase